MDRRSRITTYNVWLLPLGLSDKAEQRLQRLRERLGRGSEESHTLVLQEVWMERWRTAMATAAKTAQWFTVHAAPGGLLAFSTAPAPRTHFHRFRNRGVRPCAPPTAAGAPMLLTLAHAPQHAEKVHEGDYHAPIMGARDTPGGKGALFFRVLEPVPHTVVTTHLIANYERSAVPAGPDANEAFRAAQVVELAHALREWERDVRGPVIVAGDLNLASDEPIFGCGPRLPQGG